MNYAQTIAMARDLLADGRAKDVVQMVDALLAPIEAPSSAPSGQVVLHALMARIQVAHRSQVQRALDLLAPFDAPGARANLDDAVRAEVALWLGWAHARRNVQPDEEARALSLLDEAQQLFESTHGLRGRCWALLGRAQAYFAIDEYHLMRQALDEADALLAHTDDRQAEIWLHDLSIPAHRFEGRYDEAQHHVDRLLDHADARDDRRIRGHAWAQQAALHYDLGRAPAKAIEAATTAVRLLRRVEGDADYPLLAAYHAHIGALLRQGAWDRASTCIQDAEDAVEGYPAGQAHLQTLQARLALRQGRMEQAEALLDSLVEHAHHLPHGLHRSHVALLRGELLAHRGEAAATSWMQRALRNACETGHRGHQMRALLTLARTEIRRGNLNAADDHLATADDYDDYHGVLPYAAFRFAVLGERAAAADDLARAQVAYEQAVSAATLIGDAPRTAHLRAQLQDLTASPAAPDNSDRWGAPGATHMAALSHAAVSERLVAEAWMKAVESVLDVDWIGLFYVAEDQSSCLHEHGTRPDSLPLPVHDAEQAQAGPIRWLRLHDSDAAPMFMGLSLAGTPSAWDQALPQLRSWRPVLQLALDHARTRSARPSSRDGGPTAAPSIPLDGFIAESSVMQSLARQIDRLHASHSPVLVRGEGGTGTTLVARAVHVMSERSDAPCEVVRCASMQQDPMKARLFGREDADGSRSTGALEAADGGTLILQDVDALPASIQSALVEVLEDGTVFPVGGSTPIPVDVRFVATTNADLKTLVESDDFREDLYYHLNVIPLRVPPLRERREDLPLLVRHFLDTLRPRGTSLASVTTRALDAMLQYDWPGNVRQLRNEIERGLLYVGSEPAPTLDIGLLSDAIVRSAEAAPPASPDDADAIFRSDQTLSDVLARQEAALIRRVLRACDGQVTASAEVLGLSRQGLYKKMKRLDIDPSNISSGNSTMATS
jgi:DNA-binding NtrC family response regulator/tetratricopeptide (TPR) repeat protein